jgi:hypothetical protein
MTINGSTILANGILHPSFSVGPSGHDLRFMTEMVDARDSVIAFAVLLIVPLRCRREPPKPFFLLGM